MRHVVKAWQKMKHSDMKYFIEIINDKETSKLSPIVRFTIQSDPISEVGVNGCQASDLLEYTKCLFESLNEAFPCKENEETITYLEKAMIQQVNRTKDRKKRKVEGYNKK